MVSHPIVKQNTTSLHFDVMPKATRVAFQKCSEMSLFARGKWYLAGGTALALVAGNRKSVDLDFFTERKTFDEKKIEALFHAHGGWETTSISKGTLYGEFMGAKMSFISYPFFTPSFPIRKHGSISLLDPVDIAVMKIMAVSQRGKKRDFFDLYWIANHIQPLSEILPRIHRQYSIHQNLVHTLKSLVYFADAETDPEPIIYFNASWKMVKAYFTKEIPIITKKLLKLK